ncbi:FAD-dependent oxidoreductase [Dongia sp.]|uniref:FAD-binding oxidoreductase n=1 Tax=Dongia sp. TaxID=1977262 RepID=UPI0035AEB96B
MTAFSETDSVRSWGRVTRPRHRVAYASWLDDVPDLIAQAAANDSLLTVGCRRSYGDSCLNPGGCLLDLTRCDRLIGFDATGGILKAEAGISLDALLRFSVPRGFVVPVMPGTRHVTLGGMIANDVHGKNHHGSGTIGRWVRALELRRSDGSTHLVSSERNAGLFAATIGGLGLTGTITWAEIELRQIDSAWLEVERIPFETLDGFHALAAESAGPWEHTVAWVDCLAEGPAVGRGLFMRARHASDGGYGLAHGSLPMRLPIDLPAHLLNRYSLRLFNAAYMAAGRWGRRRYRQNLLPFFFPLDAVQDWNRGYGRDGFYQYQCVLPPESAEAAARALLKKISGAGTGSFLAVLKTFGALASPGMLSFPRPGTTLALDFPNRGDATSALLASLDAIVTEARGRLYPAKDGRMPPAMFKDGYARLGEFAAFVDPHYSSGFWRRVGQ